jgi:hypothetical protein
MPTLRRFLSAPKIAQNEPRSFRLATQEQRCRLIQERLGERGVALD